MELKVRTRYFTMCAWNALQCLPQRSRMSPTLLLKSSITASVQARRAPGRTQIYVYTYEFTYLGSERACHDSDSLIVYCQSAPRESRCTSWWLFFCHKVSLLLQVSAPLSINVSPSSLWPSGCPQQLKSSLTVLSPFLQVMSHTASDLRLCSIQVVRNSRLPHSF